MKALKVLQGAAITMATLVMLCPAGLMAETKTTSAKPVVQDISLAGGVLNGRVVNAQGVAVDGAKVVVTQANQQVASIVTNKEGQFRVSNLKAGIYQLSSGQATGTYRLWTENSAPPAAKSDLLLVSQPAAVRGQPGAYIDPVTGLLVVTTVAGATVSGFTLSEVNDLQNKVDKIPKSN